MTQGKGLSTQTPPAPGASAGRRGLGRGLDSLIPAAAGQSRAPVIAAQAEGDQVEQIPLDLIDPNPYQTRTRTDETAMRELADSIAEKGVLQPIVVRRGMGGRYLVVAGERRWRASRRAGKHEVPAIVRVLSDEQAMEITIIENLQREDLGPMEQARAFERLSRDFGLTQDQMSQRTGKDRSSIANYLRLLRLPEEVQQGIESGALSMGHAKALLSAPSLEVALKVARRIIEEDLTVRQTEELVGLLPPLLPQTAEPPKAPARPDPNVRQAERELERALGCRVKIRDKRGRGRIVSEYRSLEDFDRVLAALGAGS